MGAFEDDIVQVITPTCDNNAANWSYEPDGGIKVAGYRPGPGPDAKDAVGNRWPNLVVEVALTESEPHVRQKAFDWLTTCTAQGTTGNWGVQQVIVVKIGTNLRVDGHRTMKAMRFERGQPNNPVQEIEVWESWSQQRRHSCKSPWNAAQHSDCASKQPPWWPSCNN